MNFELLKAEALKRGIKEIEAYQVKKNGIELNFFDGEVDGNKTEMSDVICVRGVYNNQLTNVYTEKNTDESIDFILNSIIDNATLMSKSEPYFIYEGDKEYPVAPVKETNFENATLKEKLDLCNKLNELLHKSEYTFKTEVFYGEESEEVSIVNNKGLNVSRQDKDAYLGCEVVVKNGDDIKTGFDFLHLKKMEDIELEKFADKVLDEAVSQFNAESIPSGNYDVVFDKDVVRGLLGAYSSIFSADSVIKKMSMIADKIDQKIFGENITIIDDPLNELSDHVSTFDDEGVATKATTVVENGVLKSFLHNLSTASMMNTKSTGNGFKQGISGSVSVRPSNLFVKPGNKTLEELFAFVNNGVYITSLTGLHAGVNVISGAYSLQASGFKIVDGKKADPVTLIIVSSNIIDTFNSVTAIGSDLEFRNSIGAPSVALKNISISGK